MIDISKKIQKIKRPHQRVTENLNELESLLKDDDAILGGAYNTYTQEERSEILYNIKQQIIHFEGLDQAISDIHKRDRIDCIEHLNQLGPEIFSEFIKRILPKYVREDLSYRFMLI